MTADLEREMAQAIRDLLEEITRGIAVERQWGGELVKSMDESAAAMRARRVLERFEVLR